MKGARAVRREREFKRRPARVASAERGPKFFLAVQLESRHD
jgi:hypothetical protein